MSSFLVLPNISKRTLIYNIAERATTLIRRHPRESPLTEGGFLKEGLACTRQGYHFRNIHEARALCSSITPHMTIRKAIHAGGGENGWMEQVHDIVCTTQQARIAEVWSLGFPQRSELHENYAPKQWVLALTTGKNASEKPSGALLGRSSAAY